ncbi:bifunctional phosphoribosyl-AMP cyclohydrolase/phosphoribosyl-ATP diphosphatase HisIE [Metabacillus halosaccharovorans]|uniref:Histidine biosynthesis bifunctional protein HisIE n=1 Tax=Metabacillus halosaccharovorans TaxID=930124 RepID=A0ABT3DM12_9BACI|nr:bifunctional phosphoribosyl-AMP cyclohydrolase/phosphoribosyl-ATP diphosphatase HisIE [Metabacillus halosaccharovorans]MCV9888104.1 bifunctional phosphoribosyl-AMP cyclohydrolase/phosphoribosyl-ATP diphosphatase HisIE [Metabacillus halosaccharovorans]
MIESIKFDQNGLVPAIVQDAASKEVLTLAYMNEESLKKTIETKETWFYSRSRQELWHKGATSGNTQTVVEMRYDCDQDAILVLVQPEGPACHTGAYTCFSETIDKQEVQAPQDRFQILNTLETLIAERESELPEGSYTTYLFTEGVDKILKKVGEEAGEVIIAAKNRDHGELKWEVADLLFHLMVLLREQKLPLDEVLNVLEERHLGK